MTRKFLRFYGYNTNVRGIDYSDTYAVNDLSADSIKHCASRFCDEVLSLQKNTLLDRMEVITSSNYVITHDLIYGPTVYLADSPQELEEILRDIVKGSEKYGVDFEEICYCGDLVCLKYEDCDDAYIRYELLNDADGMPVLEDFIEVAATDF